MIWVGLTGGIASGKSTVSQFLKQEGAFIIDADNIVHRLLSQKSEVIESIVGHFGKKVVNAAGQIDRKRLGKIIFRDPEKRMTLNKIVHPCVFEESEAEKNRIANQDPKAVIIFDAALLIETGAYQKMDWNLLVYLDHRTQINRLIKRDHLTQEDAERRIKAQISIDDKIRRVNEVIDNRYPRHEVENAVHQIYLRLKRKAGTSITCS